MSLNSCPAHVDNKDHNSRKSLHVLRNMVLLCGCDHLEYSQTPQCRNVISLIPRKLPEFVIHFTFAYFHRAQITYIRIRPAPPLLAPPIDQHKVEALSADGNISLSIK